MKKKPEKQVGLYPNSMLKSISENLKIPKQESKCDKHKDIVLSESWNEPCYSCLIAVRNRVILKTEDYELTIERNDINLYLRFLMCSSFRLPYIFKMISIVKEDPELTIERDMTQTINLALERNKAIDGDPDKKTSIWEEEVSENQELLGARLFQLAQWYLFRFNLNQALNLFEMVGQTEKKRTDVEKPDFKELPDDSKSCCSITQKLIILILLTIVSACGSSHWGMLAFLIPSIFLIGWYFVKMLYFRKLGIRKTLLLLLPRQVGAIFVGFLLLLLSGEEIWGFLVSIAKSNYCAAIIFIAISLSMAYWFIHSQVKNRLGISESSDEIKYRSGNILLIGIMESYAVCGVLLGLSFYFIDTYSDIFWGMDWWHPWCGIEQRFFFIIVCFILLIGIFVQLFWQDKPVTEPI